MAQRQREVGKSYIILESRDPGVTNRIYVFIQGREVVWTEGKYVIVMGDTCNQWRIVYYYAFSWRQLRAVELRSMACSE